MKRKIDNRIGIIYKITNLINNKVYIGQTANIKNRISCYEKLRCKSQPKIFNSIKFYGWENHSWEIIEKCVLNEDNKIINEREIFWINKFNSFKNGLNCTSGGQNCKMSEETKEKISIGHKGQIPWNKGISRNQEEKLKISNSLKGNKLSKETKAKISKGNKGKEAWNKGKNMSVEFKEKVRTTLRNSTKLKRKRIICIDTGIIFESITEAARILGFNQANLSKVCNGHRETINGLKFKFLE